MYKFYFCTLRNKKFEIKSNELTLFKDNPKVFVKFGKTHHLNVLDRFNPNVNDGYKKSEKYLDWEIVCDFSWKFPNHDEADGQEQYWLNDVFPNPGHNKVWVEKELQCPTNDYYTEATGITELRLVTEKQRKWILRTLYERRKQYMQKQRELLNN